MDGPAHFLTIDANLTAHTTRRSVADARLEAPHLIEFLPPNTKPVAFKPRRFNNEDQNFIVAEVGRLLAVQVIEPSRSPWRAQLLVVKHKEKKRLTADNYC